MTTRTGSAVTYPRSPRRTARVRLRRRDRPSRTLEPRALAFVRDWAKLHRVDLLANWYLRPQQDCVSRPSTRRFMTRRHGTRRSNRLHANLLARDLRERSPRSEGQSSGCPASEPLDALCHGRSDRVRKAVAVTERDATLKIRARAEGLVMFWLRATEARQLRLRDMSIRVAVQFVNCWP
jgi:hypothetical protein